MMKDAIKAYWELLVGLLVISMIVVGLYAWRFHGKPLSAVPADWGNFGAYLSGTVGVAVVGATFLALIVTLSQQSRLLNQQDMIIHQQDRQLDAMTRHQGKVEAYERAAQLFPVLMNACRQSLESPLSQLLEAVEGLPIKDTGIPNATPVKELFASEEWQQKLLKADRQFLVLFADAYLGRAYRLSEFMANCSEVAPELREFFMAELADSHVVVCCALRYYYHIGKKGQAQWIGEQLDISLESEMHYYSSELIWAAIGKSIADEMRKA